MSKKKPSKGRPDRGTRASNYRLPDDTLADLDAIASHHRLGSRAAAIRFAARHVASGLPVPRDAGNSSVSEKS